MENDTACVVGVLGRAGRLGLWSGNWCLLSTRSVRFGDDDDDDPNCLQFNEAAFEKAGPPSSGGRMLKSSPEQVELT